MQIGPSASLERLEQQAGRFSDVVKVLAKYKLAGWLAGIPSSRIQEFLHHAHEPVIAKLSREERVRLALTDLGTTYIKVGQLLSTRADLIGPELAAELTKLQSQTQPDPADVVLATIQSELGKPVEELFAKFEPEAFGSASVAQVHRAELFTGEIVLVKVQKAGIQKKVEADLSILASLAELAEKHSTGAATYEPVRHVEEFSRTILNELDFTRERRNLETFARNFAEDRTVRFPRPYAELSSRRVLTMELFEGVLASDAERLQATGEDLEEFARRGATIFLDMIFRDSFYHADPHPGNLILLPGNVVGIIDCGMVGRLDEGLHEDFEDLMMSISQGDAEILTDTLWKLSKGTPELGRDSLEAELAEILADVSGGSIDQLNVGETLNRLTFIIRKYRITLRTGLSGLMKTLVLLEGTAQHLSPRFSLAEVMQPYQTKIVLARFSPQQWTRRLQRDYREWDRLFRGLPHDLNEALQKLRTGEYEVRVDHRHLDASINRLVLGIIVAALLLGSSLLWSMKAAPLVDGVSLFGVAGFAAATVLGIFLFWAIHKSGDVSPKD